MRTLREHLTYDQASIITEAKDDGNGGKNLYMEGIFVQGDKRNQNQRVYPVTEIAKAVKSVQQRIQDGYSVLGEADHPDDLQVNLDRVSHSIQKMWMNGPDGHGRLRILPTPMGNICKTLLECDVKLGVSSRGTGNVDGNGNVSDFEIQTVDIVANPSAPNAYPDPLYEQIMNGKRGNVLLDVAGAINHDRAAEKYLQMEVLKFIETLDIRRK
jgi:hypothetical protein